MIKYRLRCSAEHEFDAWFRSGADYDTQARRGLVSCPTCDVTTVEKALMAPNVATRAVEASPGSHGPSGDGDGGAQPIAAMPDPPTEAQRALLTLMRKVREEVKKNSEYVGDRFANEVRRMHLDEIPHRGVYGEASPADARALIEDGIEVYPLPVLPEDRN